MKLGSTAATDAATAARELFLSTTRTSATGSPLRALSPGISGLNTCKAALTGIDSSASSTCPSGYAARNVHRRNRGRPAWRAGEPSSPSHSPIGSGPSSRRVTGRFAAACGPHGEKRRRAALAGRRVVFRRPVHDFPVPPRAPARQGYGSRADAADRHGDAREMTVRCRT